MYTMLNDTYKFCCERVLVCWVRMLTSEYVACWGNYTTSLATVLTVWFLTMSPVAQEVPSRACSPLTVGALPGLL